MEVNMALQLEVGKYYRTRDGRKVGPMEKQEGGWYGCFGKEGWGYHPNGNWGQLTGGLNVDERDPSRVARDLIAPWHDETTTPAQPPMTFYPLQRMIDCDELQVTRQEAKEMMRAIRELYAKMEGK